MLLDYLLHGSEVNGYYLFAIPTGLLGLYLVGVAVLGTGIPWLANRPQPRPDALRWIKHERFDRPVAARAARRRKR